MMKNNINMKRKEQQSATMTLRAIIMSTIIAVANGQAVAPPGGCLVCGDGQVVTNPDAIFMFAGQVRSNRLHLCSFFLYALQLTDASTNSQLYHVVLFRKLVWMV
jgi:hypothetical protein